MQTPSVPECMEKLSFQEEQHAEHTWRALIEFLRGTDRDLFLFIARKILYYLCMKGISQAQNLLERLGAKQKLHHSKDLEDENTPIPKVSLNILNTASQIFELAVQHLSHEDILRYVRQCFQEDRSNFLLQTLLSPHTSLSEIADAIRRFHDIIPDIQELPLYTQKAVHVSIIRRFFTEQEEFIRIAKNYIELNDLYGMLPRIIFSENSRGKLGGKSSGMILASQIIKHMKREYEGLDEVKVPKTWYMTSDGLLQFRFFNNLLETGNQKYKPIEEVQVEYPHIVQIFKNSPFPPELLKGLSQALDDLGEHPLIVRSSSLLEDRIGTAFSGKYKSLFLANQGTKEERLSALLDAVAEVYASSYGPDPIEYRAERNLIDFHEEMGIMIQQVVGTHVGRYFFPAFAGVAFSKNEFRWSPRIQREDGLIRLVPGLGTRAVDRVADDYPILIAPGQPNLRVNVTMEESVRYAPKMIDVINLETNTFETVEFDMLVKEYGKKISALNHIVSILSHDHLSLPRFRTKYSEESCVVTFEGLRKNTRFVEQIRTILTILEDTLQTPVDIEFASDGQNLYLLQCRPQNASPMDDAAPIPRDIQPEAVVFSAKKFVSNGRVPNITHIVYVVPQAYNSIEDHAVLLEVGRVVGKLNKLLPRRHFILMGPGRWGSRGDIKLGVSVTYADINNTSALIEVAMQKGNYLPDLSFGTHFFQDLVESSIRYLPLYPASEGVLFNHEFLTNSFNILPELLPEHADMQEVIKVIDVVRSTDGQVLHLAMNADLDEALAYLSHSETAENNRMTYAQSDAPHF